MNVRGFALLAGLLGVLAVFSGGAASPAATPPPAVATPKPLPKSSEHVIFNGHLTAVHGFIIFASPPPATGKSAKPSVPSQEALSGIDAFCKATAATGCLYVDAKNFFKLVGAKIVSVLTPPDALPQPGMDWTRTTPYFTGPITVEYCKKRYTGSFFMNKLASFGGKPNIDPLSFLNQFNRDITVQKFKYKLQMPDPRAVTLAAAIKGAEQPFATLTIDGPVACKAKKHKKSGAYRLEMNSTITSQTHGDSAKTLTAHVTADFTIPKAAGSISPIQTPKTTMPPSTKILAAGSGTLTMASYSVSGECSESDPAPLVASDPVSGLGNVTVIGDAKHPALIFDAGMPPAGQPPSVTLTCKGYGANSGPAFWTAPFVSVHRDEMTAGISLGGNIMSAGWVIRLDPSVDGSFTTHYGRTVQAGSTTITEDTTFTLTPQ